ncbi:MAG: C10 family peptidase [Bacteroidota bacterium]|nr:C10 family peptidase [Bacteroidota bacterium]
MKIKFIKILILSIFFSLKMFSQKISPKENDIIISKLNSDFNLKNTTSKYFIIVKNDTVATLLNFKTGYAVVSYKKDFSPLKAFSKTPLNVNSPNLNTFISILEYDYSQQILYNQAYPQNISKNQQKWKTWLNDNKSLFTDSIGPLLSSEYGQVNCHDNSGTLVNVTNYNTPSNYAVGCVALTLVSTMRYYNWPIHGTDKHEYTDNSGSSTGTYSADFGNSTYLWDNIQDLYDDAQSTDASRSILGKIAFHSAVSVDMEFEYNGSTSNINKIPYAVSHYFRYDTPQYATTSNGSFWDLLDESIENNQPTQLAVYTSGGAGHAVVCDGIKYTLDRNDKYYHLNMGWWGDNNGWYLIQSGFNAGGYSIISAAVMGMTPIPELKTPIFDLEFNEAKISWYYSDKIENPVFELQQKQDDGDWTTIDDNITEFDYTFTPNHSSTYKFRVKTSQNSAWSEEIFFDPSLELDKLNEIALYPSLVKQNIYIEYKNLKNTSIHIFTMNGRKVYFENLNDYASPQKTIDVSFLHRGLYFAKIITSDKEENFKFIFQGLEQ